MTEQTQNKENTFAKMLGLLIECIEKELISNDMLAQIKSIHEEMLKLSIEDYENERNAWNRSIIKTLSTALTKYKVSQIDKKKPKCQN